MNPSLAKCAAVFEPQWGEITKPRPTAWVNGTPINPRALKGRPIPQTNLHHGGTEALRKTGGCSAPQAARADGLSSWFRGSGAVSDGGGLTDPNSQSLIPGLGAAEAMVPVNRKYGASPGFSSPGFSHPQVAAFTDNCKHAYNLS